MARLNEDNPYTLPKLLKRYSCSRDLLATWLAANIGTDHEGKPCSLLHLLAGAGYRKGQSYFTPKQWRIVTDNLDPLLINE